VKVRLSETGKITVILSEIGETANTILETGELVLGALTVVYLNLTTSLYALPPDLVLDIVNGEVFFGACSEKGGLAVHALSQTGVRLKIPVPRIRVGRLAPEGRVIR